MRTVNIYDILNFSESYYRNLVNDFSFINSDIQDFLINKAVEFAWLKQAVTYLVLTDDGKLAGYFALAIKTFEIKTSYISKTMGKKLSRVCELDSNNNCYRPPAILIAQLGKNFKYKDENLILGSELLQIALEIVLDIQYQAGGVITFLEFYKNWEMIIVDDCLPDGRIGADVVQCPRLFFIKVLQNDFV